ncbi:MAG TPA: condensation domain-containing protein, partial [Paucimonas sp.]|nr:condensation domain-containing protein [Paucimonas sp.]
GYADYGVLRQVNVGGEAMPPEGLSAWRAAGLAHVRLLNTYGPTEAAVTAMIHDCAGYVTGKLPKPTQMPIGRALPGRAIYLLDADMNPVPIGAAGELCIGGDLLARGYHGRPDLTAERFIPDPFGQPGARLYRTGDLARWKSDGVIEYLGRIDHQVKLRGFRIELPEIEACLLSHPAVREAVVLVREDRPGDQRLVAYLVTTKAVTEEEVRSHVQTSLPDYMVPSAVVYLDAMPMNPNGKLDRKALPAPDYSQSAAQTAPRNAIEQQLAAIWSEVLGIETVGIHDNFFLLGGHSLLATRLVSRIRSALQCELPVRALFEAPTIAQLGERVQPAAAQELQPIPQVPRTGPLPLSSAQQRLWFLQQLEPNSAAYNMPAAVHLVGELDVAALKQAFEGLVARHETLRTTFREENGEAVQVIAPSADIAMPVVELSTLAAEAREAEVKRIAEAEAAKPFDLKTGPLLRLTLLKLSDTEHVLLATMHHIVSDGWSMSIFTREFAEFYAAASQGRAAALAPLPIQYADFAAWQRQQSSDDKLKRELDYWKTQLGTEHPVLELPADRPRPPVQSGRGARYRFTLDAALVHPLRRICRTHGATTFMALLAVFNILLGRLSGQRDIRVGVPIANRNRLELEGLIGFFVNTQVMRAQLDARMRFSEVLGRIKEAALGAQAHQDLPFEQLVEALQPERSLSHSPLFQVMFNLIQSDAAALPELSNLVVKPLIRDDSVAQFDLSLDIVEREASLDALFTYSTDLFDAATIERFAGYYTNLLRTVLADEETRIGQLPMLGDAELQCLTREWNTATESRNCLPPAHKLFEAQVEAAPQAAALVFDDAELSYAELNIRANRLAHRLVAEGVGPDKRVGICIERSVDMIVSLLAVLKAGGAYVPLDPNYPSDRLAYMADNAGIHIVLGSAHTLQRTGLARAARRALDVTVMPATGSAHNPDVPIRLGNLAYVMYTSGSTGKPKGVGITHDALARHSQVGCEFFALRPGERMLQFSTFNFDGFVEQLYPALSCGATVILRGPDLWDSEELYRRILRHRITVADFTTAYWFQVIQDWAARGYADYGVLRQVNVGGEAMPPEGLSAWRAAGLAHVRLLNTYGPTEA